jgi:hypothetical protein
MLTSPVVYVTSIHEEGEEEEENQLLAGLQGRDLWQSFQAQRAGGGGGGLWGIMQKQAG